MFGPDPADPDQPAARRLSGLGLIPDRPGWVPDQPVREMSRPALLAADPPAADPPAADLPAVVAMPVSEAIRAALAERVPPWAAGLVERITVAGIAWAAVAAVVIVVAAVSYLHHHASDPGGGYSNATYSSAGSTPSTANSTGSGSDPPVSTAVSDPSSIVVDVGGKVRKPGLVTLPAGARVADAITAAGGPLRPRELARIDLAARVTDGQLLLVGVKAATPPGAPAATGADPSASTAPISLSTATIDQLEALPGVGPVTAQKIIDWRTAHSGFTSVGQLQQVPGIGPAHYSEISPLVTP